jgi:cell division protein FtsB
MFGWLRRWRERALEQQIDRLLAERRAMKAEWRRLHSDEPPALTEEQRRELREKRDRLSPEARKLVGDDAFFRLDDER